MTLVLALLNALAAIPTIGGYVEQIAAMVTGWWVSRQKADILSQIADSAALAAHASTDDERYAAAQSWQKTLSNPRIIS